MLLGGFIVFEELMDKISVKAVLWDYGNVLVDWSPRHLYSKIIKETDRLEYFLEKVCPMSWHLLHDKGHPMAETIPLRQAMFPEFAREIAMWKSHFGEMITGAIEENTQIVQKLYEANLPQYVLTNMPSEVVDICFDPFGLRRFFKDVIVSGDEKCAKPDTKIYEITLKRMALDNPEVVFFIDDSEANILAAKSLGFQTHWFKNTNDLQNTLREAGLPL